MCEAESVSLQTSLSVVGALECVVRRCVGPVGGSVLFTKDTGETLITRHGQRILNTLHLEHPIARMVLECVHAHDHITADGSKSFILLLASLLRGIRDSVNKQSKSSWNLSNPRVLANQLLALCRNELDEVVARGIVPHASALFGDSGYKLKGVLSALVRGYVAGRVGVGQVEILTPLLCELYSKVCHVPNTTSQEPITFLHSSFSLLHIPVSGLPIGCSQVVEGLVLACDWSVWREAEGPVKALVVWESLDIFSVSADDHVSVCWQQDWLHRSQRLMEQRLAKILQLQVCVLLSCVKQPECVLGWARLNDVAVLECCDATQLNLLCDITAAATLPLQPLQRVATLSSYGRLQVGGARCACLGVPPHGVLHTHTLVLCAPSRASLEQSVSASQGVFTMLHHLCQSVLKSREGSHDSRSLSDSVSQLIERDSVPQTQEGASDQPDLSTLPPDRSQTSPPAGSQDPSSAVDLWDVILKTGGVLPVGGAFECLMHDCLLRCGNHGNSESRRLLAEAILIVPRSVHSHKPRYFLQYHADIMSQLQLLKQGRPVSESVSGSALRFGSGSSVTGCLCVEPVCSKYQLVLSVLQCLNRLLCVGTIIKLHTSVQLHKSLNKFSEESDEEIT